MEHTIQFALLIADGILTLAVTYAGWRFKRYRETEETRVSKEKARDKLQLATARAILIRECNHYVNKGYAPLYAKDSISDMYEAYHELGGNHGVTELYNEVMKLPIVEVK